MAAAATASFNMESFRISVPRTSRRKFALDIGGSLAKLAYVQPGCEVDERGHMEGEAVNVILLTYQVDDINECLAFIRDEVCGGCVSSACGQATGVGCIKYRQNIHDVLGVSLDSDCREMEHATEGLGVLWLHLPKEELLGDGSHAGDLKFETDIRTSELLPCLLVNVGSAMTIVKVSSNGSMENICGGSTLAGLSLVGLGALLTNAKNFSELLEMASRGNNTNVDLLVRDTAGEEYNNVPLEGMVSSFGRAARTSGANSNGERFADEDLANSLVKAVTSNLAATVFYVARSEKIRHLCFCGSYLGGNKLMTNIILEQLKVASMILKHEVNPMFLRLEAYLGAVGVLLGRRNVEKETNGDLGSVRNSRIPPFKR